MTSDGAAMLHFVRRGGATVLDSWYARAPYHISPPLIGASSDVACVALLTMGGGMLGSDALSLDIHLAAGAHASIGTIGATRLLPAAAGCAQRIRIGLESGSSLHYLPEPLIPCARAWYQQRTEVDVDAGATALIGEVVTPGRAAHGERFAFAHLSLGLRVRREGRLILVERLVLDPAAGHRPVALGGHTHIASLTLVGPAATLALAAEIQALLRARGLNGSASLATGELLVARVLGDSAYALQHALRAIAALL